MARAFSLYQGLTQDHFDRIRFQAQEFSFKYSTDNDERSLEASALDACGSILTYSLSDPAGKWTPDQYDWGFERNISISTPFLFGPNGIAPSGAALGIAIIWTSKDSEQRGVIPVDEFDASSGKTVRATAEYQFKKCQLRGRVELTTILYIAEADAHVSDKELHLANTVGMVVGELERVYIILDGSSSMFPIVEVYEPVQPLWFIYIDKNANPATDPFIDCVRLNLNTAHRDYNRINQSSSEYDSKLMQEIMASAMAILILTLKQNEEFWSELESGEEFEAGSTGEALAYFINVLKWQVSTPESISVSIRKYFDKAMP